MYARAALDELLVLHRADSGQEATGGGRGRWIRLLGGFGGSGSPGRGIIRVRDLVGRVFRPEFPRYLRVGGFQQSLDRGQLCPTRRYHAVLVRHLVPPVVVA